MKDKILFQDAMALECDAFLTRDGKLAKNAPHVKAALAIEVLTPPGYLVLLRPWIGLYV